MTTLHLTRTGKPIPPPRLEFTLPPDLEAHEPPEARGLARDEVRLLVSRKGDDSITHATFRDVPAFLEAGDVLVINTSGTLPASLPATRASGEPLRLHLSTHLPGDVWVVEPRALEGHTTKPLRENVAGEALELPGGARVLLLAPYAMDRQLIADPSHARLWLAILELPEGLLTYLERFGKPIRYGYVPNEYPLSFYQTVYATEQGSAEMPSAGRAFRPEIITRLTANGVVVAPLLLHTGVASLEDHEPPYEEFYRVPAHTARVVTEARAEGRRVIAVGTTVVRALETITDARGVSHAGEGWTRVVVTPERGARAVNGILTGWHEPKASHLSMLEAIAGKAHLDVAYRAALEARYLWHEFGDLHLILP
jgi:S-adenosylmethionine:tRNA ribosyltransferase-isomerase